MKPEIIKLIEENPDLPVVPMVDGEVVADDSYQYWMGKWGKCEVTEYYLGEERVHLKDVDDEEDVYVNKGYFSNMEKALERVREEMVREGLKDASHTLETAVHTIREVTEEWRCITANIMEVSA